MPTSPPTVANLVEVVSHRCGAILQEVGLYSAGTNWDTPVILAGLRQGAKCVGFTIASPLSLADSDAAGLSTFAVERVLDEAELFALEQALLNWWRALKKHSEAMSSTLMLSGWLVELKNAVRNRVSQLKAMTAEPYREPSDPSVVVGRFGETFPTVAPGQIPVAVSPFYTGPAFADGRIWGAYFGPGNPYGPQGGFGGWGLGGW